MPSPAVPSLLLHHTCPKNRPSHSRSARRVQARVRARLCVVPRELHGFGNHPGAISFKGRPHRLQWRQADREEFQAVTTDSAGSRAHSFELVLSEEIRRASVAATNTVPSPPLPFPDIIFFFVAIPTPSIIPFRAELVQHLARQCAAILAPNIQCAPLGAELPYDGLFRWSTGPRSTGCPARQGSCKGRSHGQQPGAGGGGEAARRTRFKSQFAGGWPTGGKVSRGGESATRTKRSASAWRFDGGEFPRAALLHAHCASQTFTSSKVMMML